jgi:putative hydrolase of the HAD superfamily
LLTKLQGPYKLGLITNGAPDIQWKKINGGKLKHYFDNITVSGEYGWAKPDMRLFDAAISGLKTVKEKTIMVGDRLHTDIKGARDYGLQKTIWVNRTGKTADTVIPDYEIKDLNKIIKIMRKLSD